MLRLAGIKRNQFKQVVFNLLGPVYVLLPPKVDTHSMRSEFMPPVLNVPYGWASTEEWHYGGWCSIMIN